MRRRFLAVTLVMTTVFALFASRAASDAIRPLTAHLAQPSADLAASFPDGVAVATLADGTAATAPAAPARLRLERVALAQGPGAGPQTTLGPELYFVEAGEAIIVDELGIEGAYPEGTQLLVPMGALTSIRNDAADPASLLRLSLLPAAAVPAATPGTAGTPTTDGATTTTLLFEADVTSLPQAAAASSSPV